MFAGQILPLDMHACLFLKSMGAASDYPKADFWPYKKIMIKAIRVLLEGKEKRLRQLHKIDALPMGIE